MYIYMLSKSGFTFFPSAAVEDQTPSFIAFQMLALHSISMATLQLDSEEGERYESDRIL